MISRQLKLLKVQSFFLFGARGTGKTTLLQDSFSPEECIRMDLLEPSVFAQLQARPEALVPLVSQAVDEGRQGSRIYNLLKFDHFFKHLKMFMNFDRSFKWTSTHFGVSLKALSTLDVPAVEIFDMN